jgi:hypothetical protein
MVVVAFFMVVVARLSLSIASHQLVPSHVVSIFDVETAYYVVCFPDSEAESSAFGFQTLLLTLASSPSWAFQYPTALHTLYFPFRVRTPNSD